MLDFYLGVRAADFFPVMFHWFSNIFSNNKVESSERLHRIAAHLVLVPIYPWTVGEGTSGPICRGAA